MSSYTQSQRARLYGTTDSRTRSRLQMVHAHVTPLHLHLCVRLYLRRFRYLCLTNSRTCSNGTWLMCIYIDVCTFTSALFVTCASRTCAKFSNGTCAHDSFAFTFTYAPLPAPYLLPVPHELAHVFKWHMTHLHLHLHMRLQLCLICYLCRMNSLTFSNDAAASAAPARARPGGRRHDIADGAYDVGFSCELSVSVSMSVWVCEYVDPAS